ncbi:hypothetical protein Landi51_02094 [Colletotrichum acutatum]
MADKSTITKTPQSEAKPQWYESLKTFPGLKFNMGFGDQVMPDKVDTAFIDILCGRYEKKNEPVQCNIDRKIVIANRGLDLITLVLWVAENPEAIFDGVGVNWDRPGVFLWRSSSAWVHSAAPLFAPTTVTELKRFLRSLDRLSEFVRESDFARAYKQNSAIPYNGSSATVVQRTPIAKNPVLRARYDNVPVARTQQSPNASGATPKNNGSATIEKMRLEVNKLRAENESPSLSAC